MKQTVLHHIATGVAFLFLISWYYGLDQAGFFDYTSTWFPQDYHGAGLMLGIGLGMAPAFFIWSRFNRFIEKILDIKGKYYEDTFYKNDQPKK